MRRGAVIILATLLTGCDCGGIVNLCPREREAARPPPPTAQEISGTACMFGEWPSPDCLRYRSRTLDGLCERGQAKADECRSRRTDLPLPPGPRERRPLLPPGT